MSDTIQSLLETFIEPASQSDLKTLNAIKKCQADGNSWTIELTFGFPIADYQEELLANLQAHLAAIPGNKTISIKQNITAHQGSPGLDPIPGVKNIIAISSAKGGVGKSTIALNLALALQAQGAQVGLLDADLYGPSLPLMLGSHEQPKTQDNKLFPITVHGLQTMSIAYLTEDDAPIIWRGPMVTRALQQLLTETVWQDLDYLIIDMPPGTGDIQLTLAQKIPVTGAVIVTTPQPVACLDALKGYKMFEKVNVPVLGIVENMSSYHCPHCFEQSHIFGQGGGELIAKEVGIRLLGSVPLDANIRAGSENGLAKAAKTYVKFLQLARNCAAQLSKQAREYKNKFPKIVIENN